MDSTIRLGTASRPPVGQLRETQAHHGRLGTGFTRPGTGNRPGTASVTAPAVTARPLTQQGLVGAKSNAQYGRQIQDAQYFYGKLSEKMAQVAESNENMREELQRIEKNRSRQLQMQSRLNELIQEVTTTEAELRHYNMIIQKATMQSSTVDIIDSLQEANVRTLTHTDIRKLSKAAYQPSRHIFECNINSPLIQEEAAQLNGRLQAVTSARLNAETEGETLTTELEPLEMELETHINSMRPEERNAYVAAQAEVSQWRSELSRLDTVIEDVTKEIHEAQATISKNHVKQEALAVQTALRKLQAERVHIQDEKEKLQDAKSAVVTAQAEAQRETTALETLKTTVRELSTNIREKEDSVVKAPSGSASTAKDENYEKFQGLLAKEAEMQAYMENANSMRSSLENSISSTKERIQEEVTATKKLLATSKGRASSTIDLSQLQNALTSKHTENAASLASNAKLQEELTARKEELVKVDHLEGKLDAEAESISKSLQVLEVELQRYQNLGALAVAADSRQERLQRLLEGLRTRGAMLADVAAAKESVVHAKAAQLMGSPWFQDFQLLENKLREACSQTYNLAEEVRAEEVHGDMAPVIESIRKILVPLNSAVKLAV